MPVSTTTTDNNSAAEILLKILEQLEPIDSEQDRRIRAEIKTSGLRKPGTVKG